MRNFEILEEAVNCTVHTVHTVRRKSRMMQGGAGGANSDAEHEPALRRFRPVQGGVENWLREVITRSILGISFKKNFVFS